MSRPGQFIIKRVRLKGHCKESTTFAQWCAMCLSWKLRRYLYLYYYLLLLLDYQRWLLRPVNDHLSPSFFLFLWNVGLSVYRCDENVDRFIALWKNITDVSVTPNDLQQSHISRYCVMEFLSIYKLCETKICTSLSCCRKTLPTYQFQKITRNKVTFRDIVR